MWLNLRDQSELLQFGDETNLFQDDIINEIQTIDNTNNNNNNSVLDSNKKQKISSYIDQEVKFTNTGKVKTFDLSNQTD